MKTLRENVISTIRQQSDQIAKDYHVRKIGVFGSVARDEHNKESDVDILVEFSKPVGFFKFIDLEDYLSNILKRKVDLVTNKSLKPAIKDQILKELIYV
ncbi:MAG: nucleotidyltransferase family protein [uncultured bacterium]|uniref:Polymerase beta domain protein region protein n=1 Tax=Berkelbacteria bacterium GW2011_GWA2_38_9 TaxID=1618334 RepID=A0A0G0LEG1_9BACT|nr:MAG: nucleotidyltransferase family protein [uncultured bacterium]KKQ90258.1 MAG: polymerase beta domain protein region protein [Berkelbacteria bacterium GW2011_GWA2_38_9]